MSALIKAKRKRERVEWPQPLRGVGARGKGGRAPVFLIIKASCSPPPHTHTLCSIWCRCQNLDEERILFCLGAHSLSLFSAADFSSSSLAAIAAARLNSLVNFDKIFN